MYESFSPRPIALLGPTGSGKTAVSLAVAEAFDGEIVNCDSMQLYRGMDIGTAKLPEDQRQGIAHHLFDIWEVSRPASVAEYARAAVACVREIAGRAHTPIMVGGSMMYLQSVIDEWDFPPTDPQVRGYWQAQLRERGVEALHDHLREVDPVAAGIIEQRDPRRTVRALEVIELTGKPFSASQPPKDRPARWGTVMVGLHAPTLWLNPRLEMRVQTMFDEGLVQEVQRLRASGLRRDSTAGQAIGYAQVLDYFAGELSWEQAREQTLVATRRFARRQRSWFRRDPRIFWVDASAPDVVEQVIQYVRRVRAGEA